MSHVFTAVVRPYANGPRHVGHVTGFGVPSDVFTRYQRVVDNDALMVFGTDEHGTPLLVQAEKEGVSVRELADRYNRQIVKDPADLGLLYDLFTRTTTCNHYVAVQELFRGFYENGYMVEQTAMSAISPSAGRTLPDHYIEGTCPVCGASGTHDDQYDNYGNQLSPANLIDPMSGINGETPKFVGTEHFLLGLPALVETLTRWLQERKGWRSNVLKFSLNILKDIRPRAVSRDIDWDVPIPLEGWSENRMKKPYVWFDAVVGYLSASIEWAWRIGNPETWHKWWNDPEALSYYFMGKDNITFHFQIWPAELLGYRGGGSRGGGVGQLGELSLPTEVASSEYLTMSGSKLSSSESVIIYMKDFLAEFGPDPLRYFIMMAGPKNQDIDFTWDEFVRHVNNELANLWGNLVNRAVSMAFKNFGEVPTPGELTDADCELLDLAERSFAEVGDALILSRFHTGIIAAMHPVGEANAYTAAQEPWKLAKDESQRERLTTVLWIALQVVSDANVLPTPYLPESAQKIFGTLGGEGIWAAVPEVQKVQDDMPVEPVSADLPAEGRSYPIITDDYVNQKTAWRRFDIEPDTALTKPKPIFTKLDSGLVGHDPE